MESLDNFKIRNAAENDLSGIIYLIREFAEFEKLSNWCEVSEENLRAVIFGERKFVNCLVAEFENRLVGYSIFFPVFKSFRGERSMFLEDLYVSPDMRGKNLGFKLLKETARISSKQHCVRMDWQALKWNLPAIEFYKNLGAEFDNENFDFRLRGEAFLNLCK